MPITRLHHDGTPAREGWGFCGLPSSGVYFNDHFRLAQSFHEHLTEPSGRRQDASALIPARQGIGVRYEAQRRLAQAFHRDPVPWIASITDKTAYSTAII
ncbi:MAG: hypothetical protein H0T87_02640, partial [Gammaproteobacteria bacterium]|nr:hypothetical protein [Gammaproteobacteria bacterium]